MNLSHKNRNFSLSASRTVPILLLWIICSLVMLPVLLHPQWGMFSDPNQIIESCHKIYAHGFRWELWQQNMWVDFRPGFHLLDLLVWSISPDRPIGFFILRYCCFVGAVILTFLSCFSLSGSRVVSFFCSSVWFLSYPTYEVVYTLDKGEIYLALLFSMFVYFQMFGARLALKKSLSKFRLFLCFSLLLFSITYAIFTKQTGMLLVAYSLILFLVSLAEGVLEHFRSAHVGSLNGSFSRDAGKKFLWTLAVFVLALFSAGTFRALFVLFGGLKFKYGQVDFDAVFLVNQFWLYLQAIPEFFGLLVFALIVLAFALIRAYKRMENIDDLSDRFEIAQSLSLVLTSVAGALALCAWKSQIAYIWFPLYAMLIPAVAFSIVYLFRSSILVPTFAFVLGCALLGPARILDAESQYNMDFVFNRFIHDLSQLPAKLHRNINLVVKLKEQTSAELGEEIECALREIERLHPRVKKSLSDSKLTLTTYNIMRNSSGNLRTDKDGLPEEVAYPANYRTAPGIDKFMYLPDTLPHWTAQKIECGDIILIPFGNAPVSTAPYRGLLCFAKPWQALPESIPQLELSQVLCTSKRYARFDGTKTEIGWMAFQVNKAPNLCLPLGDYGWFRNDRKIYFDEGFAKHELTFMCEDSLVAQIVSRGTTGEALIPKVVGKGNLDRFVVPLPSNSEWVNISGSAGFDKPVLFRVKKVLVK